MSIPWALPAIMTGCFGIMLPRLHDQPDLYIPASDVALRAAWYYAQYGHTRNVTPVHTSLTGRHHLAAEFNIGVHHHGDAVYGCSKKRIYSVSQDAIWFGTNRATYPRYHLQLFGQTAYSRKLGTILVYSQSEQVLPQDATKRIGL